MRCLILTLSHPVTTASMSHNQLFNLKEQFSVQQLMHGISFVKIQPAGPGGETGGPSPLVRMRTRPAAQGGARACAHARVFLRI